MRSGKIFEGIASIYAEPTAGFITRGRQRTVGIMVQAHDFDRIERELGIEKAVRAGVSALRNGLDRELRQYLPLGYDEYILYGNACEPLKLDLSGDERQKAMITVALGAMQAMHDAWVKAHLAVLSENVTARGLDDRFKRLFVPFELLGWKLARWHYSALKLMVEAEPMLDEALVIDAYERRTQDFCRQNGIRDANTMQQKIMEGAEFYCALAGRAEELMAREQNALRIARMVVESDVVIK